MPGRYRLCILTVILFLVMIMVCRSVAYAQDLGTEPEVPMSEEASDAMPDVLDADPEVPLSEEASDAMPDVLDADPEVPLSEEASDAMPDVPDAELQIGDIIVMEDEPIPYDASLMPLTLSGSDAQLPHTAGMPAAWLLHAGGCLIFLGFHLQLHGS